MIMKNNCVVDYWRYNSINSLHEFHSKLYKFEFNESDNMVNILTINSILVNIDILSGCYFSGSTQLAIYSFFRNVSPGYKIIENLHNILYLPITADTIHSITILLTDQNGDDLNLGRENLSMRFHLREI